MPAITTFWGFAIRIALSVFLGALIGTERELTKHYTGIVTNIIVCVGAFAFTSFSYIAGDSNTDVTRIAAQVVCGTGFLGAGVILSDGTKVKGINTAATVWAAASVGILCCLDKFWYAAMIAATIVVSHLVIHPITEAIKKHQEYDKTKPKKSETFYSVSVVCTEESAAKIKSDLVSQIRETDDVLLRKLQTIDLDSGCVKVRAEISTKIKNNDLVESIVAYIAANKNIMSTGWKYI